MSNTHTSPDTQLSGILSTAERLGVVGSPSSTGEFSVDIINEAVARKLVGELAMFCYEQDNSQHFAIGQITEIQLRNIWHEDATMRSLVRQKGQIDAISGRQDTYLGKMNISAVFKDNGDGSYGPSMLGTIPPTGTYIHAVTDDPLLELLGAYQDHLFYLGKVYGSRPMLPMWFKHFGSGYSGAGEAYHIGVFGKTGSGKSVLAKMLVSAYSQHEGMGILILDPQGEFTADLQGKGVPGGFELPLQDIVKKKIPRRAIAIHASQLVLDTWDLFEELLAGSRLFAELTIKHPNNRTEAAGQIVARLRKKKVNLSRVAERTAFDRAWEALEEESVMKIIYPSEGPRKRVVEQMEQIEPEDAYERLWKPVANLFAPGDKRHHIDSMVTYLLTGEASSNGGSHKDPPPVISVDLSRQGRRGDGLWTDRIQLMVLRRILEILEERAEAEYQKGSTLNTLVVIDEAHRVAGNIERDEDETTKSVKLRLRDAARTTRKYGLGWMFISQTLASIDREVIQQLRIMFFGFGLSLGQEYEKLRELVGSSKGAIDLYRQFRDPHSALNPASREYSFMTIGPVSPLSFSGTPLFLSAFTTVADFEQANGL